jgi:hypothetical protein
MASLTSTALSGLSKLVWLAIAVLVAGGFAMVTALPASASGPTCAGFAGFDWVNHGDHIVGDYLIGNPVGEGTGDWPPAGQVGDAVSGGGPEVPGASGIHLHGGGTVPPGASFCLEQSNAPTGEDLPEQAGP